MKKRFTTSKAIFGVSVPLGLFLGVFDVLIDALVFGEAPILEQVLRPTPSDVYVRGGIMMIVVVFGVIVSRLTLRLEKANEEIKTLKHILPSCSSCRRIRKDDKTWVSLENYVLDHTDTHFSHGVCPDCQLELYGKQYTDE